MVRSRNDDFFCLIVNLVKAVSKEKKDPLIWVEVILIPIPKKS